MESNTKPITLDLLSLRSLAALGAMAIGRTEIAKELLNNRVKFKFLNGRVLESNLCEECGRRKKHNGWKYCKDCFGNLDVI